MVKDFKYIIKRIIIGVGIALVLMALKGTLLIGVHAQEISSFNWGSHSQDIGPGASSFEFNVSGEPWANWRYGYLHFSFGINKKSGSSTDPIILPRNVIAFSGSTGYICDIGSLNTSNSTYVGSTYSVTCPMDLGAPGVSRIIIGFQPVVVASSVYNVTVGGYASYEQVPGVTVNVDTSSTTNAINNQITNDNSNTQNIINNNNQNTQSIINNQNSNTEQITNTLTDDEGVADNDINSLFQELDVSSDTPISDLLTMPITLVQAYMNGVGGSCSAVNLGSLYGTNLIIPCIDLEARLGSGLWNLIDVLFSLFMIYNIAMLIINIFDKVTSLDDTFSFFTKGGDM